MKYLPWRINQQNPKIIIDNSMCIVLDLSIWGSIGAGHNAEELAEFIVNRANELSKKENL